jgi:hypothetical protein
MLASAYPLFGRQLADGESHGQAHFGQCIAGPSQSVDDGNGRFTALVKLVTTVWPVGATVAVGCIVTCGAIIRSEANGPSGLLEVAKPVAVV